MAAVTTKYCKRLREVQKQKSSLAMKIKLFLSVLLLAAMVPGVQADANAGGTNTHSPRGNSLVTPVEEPRLRISIRHRYGFLQQVFQLVLLHPTQAGCLNCSFESPFAFSLSS